MTLYGLVQQIKTATSYSLYTAMKEEHHCNLSGQKN